MRFLRNNWLILLEIIVILGLIITTTIICIPPGKPEIIASLVSFNLNGEVKVDLQAQILIENLTTLELEVNKELISLIESDMLFLSHQIQGLERINIYNLSYNPLPGRVNLFLENVRYRERKYLREMNSIISANKDKWWYVDEFTFTPILEEGETRDKAYLYSSCGENEGLELLSIEAPFSFNDNLTLLQNETLIASWWIPDDGNWTFNDEFYQTLVVEIYSLKERIKGIEEISIPWINRNETDFNFYNPTIYNLSEPIPSEVAFLLGQISIKIDYMDSLTRTEMNTIRKITEKLLISKWYFSGFIWYSCSDITFREFLGLIMLMFVMPIVGILTLIFMGITIGQMRKKRKE